MKVHALQNPVERSGFSAESTFSIKATAHSFEILSSGLYSNKPLAIVRELSCNARDGHMAKGNLDVPFEIKLPNNLDSTFYIKDFGIGLSEVDMCGGWRHVDNGDTLTNSEAESLYQTRAEALDDGYEQVGGIYNTYFESTKTYSDDFVGQLGLGSKSPFSYTDSFTVESRFGGKTTIYTCFKNEEGFPSIAKMSEKESTDPTGITVSMSVRSGDYSDFEKATKQGIMYFDVQPRVIGVGTFEPYTFEYTSQGDEWAIRKNNNWFCPSGMFVVQGGVAYPVDVSVVTKDHPHLSALASIDCNLFMPIGSVDVAASREALQYKPRTIANIVVILEKMLVNLATEIQKQLDECPTDWERIIAYKKLKTGSGNNFTKLFENCLAKKLKDPQGNPIVLQIGITPNPIMITTMYVAGRYRYSSSPKASRDTIKFVLPDVKTGVIVYPKIKGAKAIVEAMMRKGGFAVVMVIHPIETALFDQKIVNDIVLEMGSPPVYDWSDLQIEKRSSTYVKRPKEEKLIWQGFTETSDNFSRKCWDRENIDLLDDDDAGVYVPIERFSVEPCITGKDYSMDRLCRIAKNMNFNDRIVGLTKKDVAIVQKNPEWIEYDVHMQKRINKANTDDAIFKSFGARYAIDRIGESRLGSFLGVMSNMTHLVSNKAFLDLIEPLKMLKKMKSKFEPEIRMNIPNSMLDIDAGCSKYTEMYNQMWIDAFNMAPMLNCIDWGRCNTNDMYKYVSDYINEHTPVDDSAEV